MRHRLIAALGLSFLAAGCSRSYERPVNGWCKIRVREPMRLGGGTAQGGPNERDTVFVRDRRPDRWKDVAKGTGGSVARIADDHAVLFVPSPGAPGLLVTPDGAVKPLAEVFPCDGLRTISPDGRRVDCARCVEGAADGCRTVSLDRFPAAGGKSVPTTVDAPDASCRFRRPGVRWYDPRGRAYLLAVCANGASTLYRAGGAAVAEKFTSPNGSEDPKSWHAAIGQIELLEPKPLHPIRGRPNEAIPR